MSRRIACLDLDAFFVEVALKEHPELRGKPLAVGGAESNRGVVCSASYEARKFGVRSGMAMYQARCRCQDLQVLPVPAGISDFSHQVRDCLRLLCPVVETASVDEFYLDFTGCDRIYKTNLEIADRVCRTLALNPALPSTIGFGTNKLVAKIASDLAKPRGALEVLPGCEASFLAPLALKKIPGIGPVTEERLKMMGLSRVGDIAALSLDLWTRTFGKMGESLYWHALGVSDSPVVPDDKKHHQKQLSRERTLARSTDSADALLALLSRLAEDAVYEMRSMGLTCAGISVKLRYDDFVTQSRSHKINRTNDDSEIFAGARSLFHSFFQRLKSVRLIGLSLDQLQSGGVTCDLWHYQEAEELRTLIEVVDSVRDRFGARSILRARSLVPPRRDS